jgi:hypothetical protein
MVAPNAPECVLMTHSLCKIYKEKSALLCQTGGGVGAPEDDEAEGVHHYLNYYIPHDSPHHDTPAMAVNIWGASYFLS